MVYVETSAKTAANCALVFETVAKKVSGYQESASNHSPPVSAAAADTSTPLSTNASEREQ